MSKEFLHRHHKLEGIWLNHIVINKKDWIEAKEDRLKLILIQCLMDNPAIGRLDSFRRELSRIVSNELIEEQNAEI